MQTKKPLPYSATKDELVSMYIDQMPEATILRNINTILEEKKFSKHTKRIPHLEFMEFVETFGLPKDYYLSG